MKYSAVTDPANDAGASARHALEKVRDLRGLGDKQEKVQTADAPMQTGIPRDYPVVYNRLTPALSP